MTDAEKKRAQFVEFRRGIIALIRYGVAVYGCSYSDFLPAEATSTPAPVYSGATVTPVGSFESGR